MVHCRKETYDVYIGRPSKWENPYSHKPSSIEDVIRVATREEAIQKYTEHLLASPDLLADIEELRGKVLGCWCSPSACHGDVIAGILDDGLQLTLL